MSSVPSSASFNDWKSRILIFFWFFITCFNFIIIPMMKLMTDIKREFWGFCWRCTVSPLNFIPNWPLFLGLFVKWMITVHILYLYLLFVGKMFLPVFPISYCLQSFYFFKFSKTFPGTLPCILKIIPTEHLQLNIGIGKLGNKTKEIIRYAKFFSLNWRLPPKFNILHIREQKLKFAFFLYKLLFSRGLKFVREGNGRKFHIGK